MNQRALPPFIIVPKGPKTIENQSVPSSDTRQIDQPKRDIEAKFIDVTSSSDSSPSTEFNSSSSDDADGENKKDFKGSGVDDVDDNDLDDDSTDQDFVMGNARGVKNQNYRDALESESESESQSEPSSYDSDEIIKYKRPKVRRNLRGRVRSGRYTADYDDYNFVNDEIVYSSEDSMDRLLEGVDSPIQSHHREKKRHRVRKGHLKDRIRPKKLEIDKLDEPNEPGQSDEPSDVPKRKKRRNGVVIFDSRKEFSLPSSSDDAPSDTSDTYAKPHDSKIVSDNSADEVIKHTIRSSKSRIADDEDLSSDDSNSDGITKSPYDALKQIKSETQEQLSDDVLKLFNAPFDDITQEQPSLQPDELSPQNMGVKAASQLENTNVKSKSEPVEPESYIQSEKVLEPSIKSIYTTNSEPYNLNLPMPIPKEKDRNLIPNKQVDQARFHLDRDNNSHKQFKSSDHNSDINNSTNLQVKETGKPKPSPGPNLSKIETSNNKPSDNEVVDPRPSRLNWVRSLLSRSKKDESNTNKEKNNKDNLITDTPSTIRSNSLDKSTKVTASSAITNDKVGSIETESNNTGQSSRPTYGNETQHQNKFSFYRRRPNSDTPENSLNKKKAVTDLNSKPPLHLSNNAISTTDTSNKSFVSSPNTARSSAQTVKKPVVKPPMKLRYTDKASNKPLNPLPNSSKSTYKTKNRLFVNTFPRIINATGQPYMDASNSTESTLQKVARPSLNSSNSTQSSADTIKRPLLNSSNSLSKKSDGPKPVDASIIGLKIDLSRSFLFNKEANSKTQGAAKIDKLLNPEQTQDNDLFVNASDDESAPASPEKTKEVLILNDENSNKRLNDKSYVQTREPINDPQTEKREQDVTRVVSDTREQNDTINVSDEVRSGDSQEVNSIEHQGFTTKGPKEVTSFQNGETNGKKETPHFSKEPIIFHRKIDNESVIQLSDDDSDSDVLVIDEEEFMT